MKTHVLRSTHDLNFPNLFKHLWYYLNHYIPLHSYSTLVHQLHHYSKLPVLHLLSLVLSSWTAKDYVIQLQNLILESAFLDYYWYPQS